MKLFDYIFGSFILLLLLGSVCYFFISIYDYFTDLSLEDKQYIEIQKEIE